MILKADQKRFVVVQEPFLSIHSRQPKHLSECRSAALICFFLRTFQTLLAVLKILFPRPQPILTDLALESGFGNIVWSGQNFWKAPLAFGLVWWGCAGSAFFQETSSRANRGAWCLCSTRQCSLTVKQSCPTRPALLACVAVLLAGRWRLQNILVQSINAFGSPGKATFSQEAQIKPMQLIKSRKVVLVCIFSALVVGSDKVEQSWGPLELPLTALMLSRQLIKGDLAIVGSSLAWICGCILGLPCF